MINLIVLAILFVTGWVAVALIGSQAYFRGEQSKPIHERNWRSESFANLSESLTGKALDFNERTPGFRSDSYSRQLLPEQ
ncbi:MAG: photosystem II protein, Psb35-related [Thainema sp.]